MLESEPKCWVYSIPMLGLQYSFAGATELKFPLHQLCPPTTTITHLPPLFLLAPNHTIPVQGHIIPVLGPQYLSSSVHSTLVKGARGVTFPEKSLALKSEGV